MVRRGPQGRGRVGFLGGGLRALSPLAELGGLRSAVSYPAGSGEELRRMLDFFVHFFLPLDDHWRLRFFAPNLLRVW